MKLAIVTSHPVQYYAPWFRYLAQKTELDLKVFYLWDFGVTAQEDREFKTTLTWDIPLLEGYAYEFVENVSKHPGTSNFWGLNNPELKPRISAYQPDAVLMMLYNYGNLYPFIFSWNQCPLLFRGDSHRIFPQQGWKSKVKRRVIQQIFRQFSALLYVGQANYRYFQDHGVSADKLFFTPHSVDNQRFLGQRDEVHQQARAWKSELGIAREHRVILFAGKFINKKRPQDLVKAFKQANLSNVSLLMVGAGSLDAELKNLAADHPHIYFAPFQNQSLMPRTLAIADLLVLPSYGSGETWGLIVNEAMNLGKPVAVSDHVGCAEDLIESGRNGYVFPAGNIEALTHTLKQAFSESHLSAMGERSSEKIQSYSYRQMSEGLQAALASIAA